METDSKSVILLSEKMTLYISFNVNLLFILKQFQHMYTFPLNVCHV